jgi:mono/diheme cytochrome c family protein
MRRIFQFCFLISVLAIALLGHFSFVAPASAAPKGSESKGRYYFRGTCKSCHTKGEVGGEITPLNKTQAQWKMYFASGKHSHGKEVLTKFLTDDQLRDVAAFLDAHAADSLQPETCGK